MTTEIVRPDIQSLRRAAEIIKGGGLVAMPTETVYGLAGNAYDPDACGKIFVAKGRPQDNPLIIHVSNLDMLYKSVKYVPELALRLAERFWSGPLTMIFKKDSIVPDATSGGLDTVAVRMPDNEAALNLIELCGFPLAAPSANLSGSPSPTSAGHVYEDLCGRIPMIIDGGECRTGVESTVICFTDDDTAIKILRPGAVTAEMLAEYADVTLDGNVFKKPDENERVLSPGMKYKHYSPKTEIIIVETDNAQALAEFLNEKAGEKICAVLYGDETGINVPRIDYGVTAEQRAHNLFAALRETDGLGVKTAYVRCPEKTGLGTAVYNRLLRAAAFRVVKI
ncbi:MAG: threonylcarbamoyl-AMP synthase [Eubacterium sp.]|nr:threonylcarbamoyl-AMP synthase [Eubacterium sp.]